MTAEEKAEKAYPYPTWSNETTRAIDDLRRFAFIEGYHQAEKDNELTWEDLATIEKLGDDFIKQNHTPMSDEEFYKEVLKRFKDFKKRKKL